MYSDKIYEEYVKLYRTCIVMWRGGGGSILNRLLLWYMHLKKFGEYYMNDLSLQQIRGFKVEKRNWLKYNTLISIYLSCSLCIGIISLLGEG